MALWYLGPNPTVDLALLRGSTPKNFEVLLVQRASEPFQNQWAFPAGFQDGSPPSNPPSLFQPLETPEQAARREFFEETGQLCTELLIPAGTYSGPGRDPRESASQWTHTHLFTAFCTHLLGPFIPQPGEVRAVQWHPLHNLPPLAFDHKKLLLNAIKILATHPTTPPCIQHNLWTTIAGW